MIKKKQLKEWRLNLEKKMLSDKIKRKNQENDKKKHLREWVSYLI
jgi:hypothetical protein